MSSTTDHPSIHLARDWARSQQNVHAFIASLVPERQVTEELVQETAAQIFSQADRYDPARPFLPWAFGFAQRVVLQHRQRRARDRHVFDQEAIAQLAATFEELAAERQSKLDALAACREKLPPRDKLLCRFRYEMSLSVNDIASRIGSTSGAVRTQLHRVRESLRACVQRRLTSEEVSQ